MFLFVFQGIVFRTYYTQRKVNELKADLTSFVQKGTFEDISYEELIFSRDTNTFTSIVSIDDISSNLSDIDITIIEINTDDTLYRFYAPKTFDLDVYLNKKVSAAGYELPNDVFIPSYLSINDETLIRRNNSTSNDSDIYDVFSIDEDSFIQINGTITNVSIVETPELNPLISDEILNIASQNYISLVNFENGSYYFTNSAGNRNSSLVFFSTINIDNNDFLVISVYPMDYIDQIVLAAGRANVYMFIIVLAILILSAFVYSREFSRPLLFINKKTKELSLLNFSEPLIQVDSSDEFSELARNINTLSVNLKTTLHQLSEQNKQLLEKIELENKDESNRREFLQGMGHELKTPLAIIQASAEAIEKNIYDNEKDKESALILIQDEVQKTKKMISDMMDVYRIDSPNYMDQWTEVDLKELVLEIDKMLSPLYQNEKLNVSLKLDECKLLCEKDKIELVITNLINNAIKYTPSGNDITVFLTDNEHQIHFSVVNYGVSLTKDEMEKIFNPFYRLDKARSRKEGSTGLGLYIVNQSLKQYDSECKVSSDENSVTFEFNIEKSI